MSGGNKMWGFATKALHVGSDPEQWDSAQTIPPITTAVNAKLYPPAPGHSKGFFYGRDGNPTRSCLEQCLASLEGAKYCRVFSSGFAAQLAVFHLLQSGDHVVSSYDLYSGTLEQFDDMIVNNGIKITYVDMTNPHNLVNSICKLTKLIWLETPSNPFLNVCNIEEITNITKRIDPGILVVVDNTLMTPFFQKPLMFGCDLVLESITKYISGHNDVIMGALCTNDKELENRVQFLQQYIGAIPSSFDCYLVHRGIKTLHLRMTAHMENALQVAKFLEKHSRIEKVFYPELPSHPHHALHKKQTTGMSGMVSFLLKGSMRHVDKFMSALKVCIWATSCGGLETIIEVPAAYAANKGVADNFIRLSVGVENVTDIIEDLQQALDKSEEADVCELLQEKKLCCKL